MKVINVSDVDRKQRLAQTPIQISANFLSSLW